VAGVVPYVEGLGSPIVAANMDASQEPTLDGKFTPSVVIDREGTKIGIIGSVSKNTPVRTKIIFFFKLHLFIPFMAVGNV